ncbi:MAG TPA: hypothetical protein VF432_11145 [Thermoanaerobaculia bacterium]
MSLRTIRSRFISLLAVATLTFTFNAFAAKNQNAAAPLTPGEAASPMMDSLDPVVESADGRVALTGLAFQLPEAVDAQTPLVASVSSGKKILASETIALLAGSSPDSAIVSQFLGNHVEELVRLRKMNEARPGVLRFQVAAGDRALIDVPFSEADSLSLQLAATTSSVVGQSQRVDISFSEPQKLAALGMQPEPECEAACNATYVECYYEICDQRGDCSYCWTDYQYCAASCPQVCVEPKEVYTWKTNWSTTGSSLQEWCKMPGAYKYVFRTTTQTRTVYKRTVNCNGTYSDAYQGTEQQQSVCKVYVGGPCGYAPVWTSGLPPTCNI